MKIRTAILVVLALACAPLVSMAQTAPPPVTATAADNDYAVTAFGNINFSGGLFADREKGTSGGGGASLIFWGRGIASAEVDFNFNPGFFGTKEDLGSNGLNTFTVSGVFGPWLGPNRNIRPYGVVGGGLLRGKISNFSAAGMSTSTTLGVFDLGGGVFYYFTPKYGFRGDIRYRFGVGAETDPTTGWGLLEDWTYARASLGFVFGF